MFDKRELNKEVSTDNTTFDHGSGSTFNALSCVTRSSLEKPIARFALKLEKTYSLVHCLS